MKLTFTIKKPVDFVFDYLTDVQKFVSAHPVITRIDKLGTTNYLVYETLKLGFLPFSFTYPVTIESDLTNKRVIMRATVLKLTKIDMNFILKPDGDCSVIEETIHFTSPLPIEGILQRIFKTQHQQLMKNIEMR
ncbi:SRPBCC family protein [Spirosoma areae]